MTHPSDPNTGRSVESHPTGTRAEIERELRQSITFYRVRAGGRIFDFGCRQDMAVGFVRGWNALLDATATRE